MKKYIKKTIIIVIALFLHLMAELFAFISQKDFMFWTFVGFGIWLYCFYIIDKIK